MKKFGIWSLEFGIWNLEFEVWNLEFGTPIRMQHKPSARVEALRCAFGKPLAADGRPWLRCEGVDGEQLFI